MTNFDSERFAKSIQEAGVRKSFGILGGGRSLEVVAALKDNGIEYYPTYFEGSAAIMAGISGLLSKKSGLALSIKGPGLANLVSGLSLCKHENLPMIACTEAYENEINHMRMHKRMNHKKLVSEVVKKSSSIKDISKDFFLASELARQESPGPVHIDLVYERASSSHDDSNIQKANSGIEAIWKTIDQSANIAIILGSLAERLDINDEIQKINLPIFTTLAAKGIISEELFWSAGIFTGAGLIGTPETTILKKTDTILAVGLRPNEILDLNLYKNNLINLDVIDDREIYGKDVNVKLCCKDDIHEILQRMSKYDCEAKLMEESKSKLGCLLASNSFLPVDVYKILQSNLPDFSRYVVDTGNFCTVAEHVLLAKKPLQMIFSANSRTMGAALPMGIGASLYDRDCPTVIICGDGGIGMYVSELRAAVEYKLKLLVILMTDGAYSSILGRARKLHIDEDLLTVRSSSWIDTMNSFGLISNEVNSRDELNRHIKKIDLKKGPHFLQCNFERDSYLHFAEKIRG